MVLSDPFTDNLYVLEVVPIPTFPSLNILIASVPPFVPTWNTMASVVPVPDVDLKVSAEAGDEPPTTKGTMAWVVSIGESENTTFPVPVVVAHEVVPALF